MVTFTEKVDYYKSFAYLMDHAIILVPTTNNLTFAVRMKKKQP